jgi:hypothetical protein
MRDHLIGFIEAVRAAALRGDGPRPMIEVSNHPTAGSPVLRFGYGYFDPGKVVWDGRDPGGGKGEYEEMETAAAVDRFLEFNGLA